MAETRRVGVAVDFSPCSRKAVKWAIDMLTRKGDHLILITVRPALIPLSDFSNSIIMKKYEVSPDPETLDIVSTASRQKEIIVLLKIYWGDPREKLCESVDNIPLDSLVIGNRGHGTLQRVIMGSVSNYVVNNASVPVTVVKS
ncbi:hypothetical protein ACS0TY_027119 [Phlomoides rotata]